jgi:hypothetical protein
MSGYADLRLQVANDQIQRLHAEADARRLARTASKTSEARSARSIGSVFGWSRRILGLAQ